MTTEVRVPTLGESVTEATVATWFVKPGDTVQVDQMLCELETDKVTVEVPAPAAGQLAEIVAAEGETVGVNTLLAQIAAAGGAAAPTPQPKASKPAAPAPQANEAKMTDVMVPTLGESVTEATVATWFKKVGDAVAVDEMLCELETDKVSVEVPSPVAGVLAEIVAAEGATVDAAARLAVIAEGASAGDTPAPAASAPAKAPAAGDAPPASPSARKAMAAAGLSADAVSGTGRGGRVMKEDVARAAAAAPAAAPAPVSIPVAAPPAASSRAPVAAEDAAREERVKMTRLRATIARRLKDAQNTAAMLTTYNEVDMSGVMEIRNSYKDMFEKKHGVKMGFMAFFVKACCHALKEVPEVNAEIDGQDIVYKNYVHMGVAVGTPTGLVVPVVRDADQMGFAAIEKKIAELGARARDGKLSMAEMQGGSFTISNGGVYGSLMSSPILNPPQSGILGMHKIQERPVVVGGQIVIRPMMYLALSYDHRIVDGKGAVTFLVRVKEALEDPRRLLMDL
ncbi:2-oxoglutarate dehydrogenase complex dihydrolipoyllysine-residue succinyltransferase [Phaeovulum vinaykumarii]|uniref:Dihydrolipoyllysine-residue succinyltransferase component of 2-oxoglutarate dehydrogenase complex n=1 Tax=Phaeovulum vinaykumarii TaxID=407234 RepID=A0A1N7KZ70_9RHOB|nr:2-oxoglutarate dehydrogenase complex dihydrolipoyllysine-residue succinyltransferase [Phaeovulum vinaykumarii]SIS66837.1 2-oxoglutarate dehydrogenase E2 component [Phaeovulum vinaykumarii]SOC00947.1 2-oxoglutarate dehydrogenase E2 component [Phaeovulum vinaykumarii]